VSSNTPARELPKGVWQTLLPHAFTLIDEIARLGTPDPFWTFGGGTVLMLRHQHRMSKDIDIFVPDPQYLGFVSPRLSDAAENVSQDYVEGPGFVKLLRPEGEIDFVASPNLRGDRATARDLFDLSLVIEREPAALATATPYLTRHRAAFLSQLEQRRAVLSAQFEAIDTLDYRPSYDQASQQVNAFLNHLP
jgi:hypothetical protein